MIRPRFTLELGEDGGDLGEFSVGSDEAGEVGKDVGGLVGGFGEEDLIVEEGEKNRVGQLRSGGKDRLAQPRIGGSGGDLLGEGVARVGQLRIEGQGEEAITRRVLRGGREDLSGEFFCGSDFVGGKESVFEQS